MTTYTVLSNSFTKLDKQICHIANKCRKSGVSVTYTYSDPYEKVVTVNGKHYSFSLVDISLDCIFKYNGWESLGLVQRKDGVVQCYFKDPSLIREYSTTDFHCDHCKKHVHRNSVVVLQHTDGVRKVVGTSCVKEFTCGLDGNLIASFIDITKTLIHNPASLLPVDNSTTTENMDDWEIASILSHGTPNHTIEEVVSSAAHLINLYGFKTSMAFDATWKFIPDCLEQYSNVTEEEIQEAREAIHWVLNLSEEDQTSSSYLFNLYSLCKADYCTGRHFGLLASLIPTYRKQKVKAEEKQLPQSNHIGSLGERITTNVTITKRLCFDSFYGNCWVIIMHDPSGNILKWSTSKRLEEKFKEGYSTSITGTIKDHDTYNGQKQTIITRCKFSD